MDLTGVDLTTEVVRTERLLLRPWRPDDVAVVHRACQDPEIQRWNIAIPSPYTLDDARVYVLDVAPRSRAAGTGMPVAIEADGELVGASGLRFGDSILGPDIGYWMAPWARDRGYAAETTRALADWVLAHGAPRVHLYADVRNVASHRVARRAGFSKEGVVRSGLEYRDGTRGDAVLFSRLPGD
jgi:RimJ/RimL family protein N-acetyltransferase